MDMDKKPKRKNIRLKNYDYSQAGYYYVTLCTEGRKKLFWNSDDFSSSQFISLPLSSIGKIVDAEINKIDSIYPNVKINKYVIMPNHIHMIIEIHDENKPKIAPTISRIIQQFKGSISKQIGYSIWQRSFYDNIIRNKQQYLEIYKYIETNPFKWKEDRYFV